SFTFSLNQAIAARSKYIWMLDARNVVRVEHFETFLEMLDNKEFGLVHLVGGGRHSKDSATYVDVDDFLSDVSMGIIDTSRNLIRTDYIRGYNPREFGAGTGIPAVPLLMHVALSAKQNMIYYPLLFDDARIDFISEARDPIRAYAKNLLAVYDAYEDDKRNVSISPATVMKIKSKVSDYLLPLIMRLFVLRKSVKGLEAKSCRQTIKQGLGWRPLVSVMKWCVSPKVWGRVFGVLAKVLRKVFTFILALFTMLICNVVVTRALRSMKNSLVTYRFRYRVKVGKRCSVESPVVVEGRNVRIGTDFSAKPGLILECVNTGNYTPKISVGDFVSIERNVRISAIRNVTIGNNVMIGQDVIITDFQRGKTDIETFHIVPADRQLVTRGSVVIEDNVVIGPRAIILAGVTIGKGAVIGAGAVVTRDVPPYAVAKGVPARF
ncbi:MAG: acyltransferase, partial [Bacteroidaceae bacterium]